MNAQLPPSHGEKPNFLMILVDVERYPPVYEQAGIQAWRRQNLITHELLQSNGMAFHRHYIGSAACCPSRATLLTGQYPSHNLTADPLETCNLAHPSFSMLQTRPIQEFMANLLEEQRQQKRLEPSSQ